MSSLERLKSGRVLQALSVYLGAAWVVLQITETVIWLLNLPTWVGPTAVVFMLIGFVVVMATGWIQGRPETTDTEQSGALPTDWEVDPADVLASVRAGRLPHLTWARTVLGFDAEHAWATDDYEQAYLLFQNAYAVGGGIMASAGVGEMLAEAAVRTERWTEALELWEGLSRAPASRTWAKFHLGQAYEAIGRDDRALDAYRTFLARTETADPGWDAVGEARAAARRLGG
jgi:tetratricopeptide (TPR) repeat protein